MRRRLIAGFVAVSIVLVLALALPLGALFSRYVRDKEIDALEDRATAIAVAFEQNADVGEPFEVRNGGEEATSVVDASGALLTGAPLDPAAATLAAETGAGADRSRSQRRGDRLFVAVLAGNAGQDSSVVIVSQPTSDTDRTVRNGWLMLGLLGSVVVGMATLIAVRLASWIARPLDELRRTSEAFGETALGARVDETTWPPDLRRLGATFNRMAQRIEELVAQNESFVHEASHQLRTPLTALRLRLDNLSNQVGSPDDAMTEEELGAATDAVDRLSRLTDGLLTLARAERRPTERAGTVDLGRLLAERLDQWHPLAEEHGIEFRHLQTSPVIVRVDPDRLDQVLDNLLANAFDASAAGTTITCRATSVGDVAELSVVDEGCGMTDEQRTRAFDRFWTTADQRPTGRAGLGGTGLGLPIAARLLAQDGATIRLEPGADGVGTAAIIRLTMA